jgi:purine-binding chemotaxis protein CheW
MEHVSVFAPKSASPRPPWNAHGAERNGSRTTGLRDLALLRLGDNWFGIDAESIERVVPLDYVAWVSLDHGLILGTVGLHGRLLPVVDLRALLDLGASALHDHGSILVARAGDAEIGIFADEFDDVFPLPSDPASGRCTCDERVVLIVDPLRIVAALREHTDRLAVCG